MKSSWIILCFVSLIFFSCDKNEESEDRIEGKWFLTQFSGGIAGISQEISKGDIVWEFDDELDITNNYAGNVNVSPVSGQYTYEFLTNDTEIKIDNDVYSFTEISDDSISISQQFPDGFGYLLVR